MKFFQADRIKNDGYPVETHTVITSDKYILTLHRIPPKNSNSPVIFLMHGLSSSSSDFVILGPKRALAYKLSDAGYDVWMGNARGNTFSRKHEILSPYTLAFWRFSWNEIGIYDLPAMIDYILEKTQNQQIHYIGHSQGTTTLLVLLSEKPEYNKKLQSAHLLAPAAFMGHMKSISIISTCPSLSVPNPAAATGSIPIMTTDFEKDIASFSCDVIPGLKEFCKLSIFEISGFDHKNLNESLLADIYATSPAGASASQLYITVKNSFLENLENLIMVPPSYSLNNTLVPTFLYYGQNDFISAPEDVLRLRNELSNVKLFYKVSDPMWTHLDFIWATNADSMVYEKVLKGIESV
uniref:AB hydrolase-1 domain-containing protein n=1 Tax=Megaselia scalaris TaxID=36166 RepID=T1H449_MEGSC